MPKNWNKGYTKDNHPSVLQISMTMKKKGLDNFAEWRKKMKALGKIKSTYPALTKNADLAELIGVVLGDGRIGIFPRSEVLLIFCNAKNKGFIKRYSKLVEKIFNKKPRVGKISYAECVRISLYEKHISKRIGVPSGARKNKVIKIPGWILENEKYIVRYLRGLYEAEGSLCIHEPTYTHKFLFSNRNVSMISNVKKLLQKLGFHPHVSVNQVQISKKEEVYKVRDLLNFRKY